MIGIIICVIFIIAIVVYLARKFKEINEQSEIITECTKSLNEALEGRYDAMEDMINYSRDYLEDENRFVVKLVQAKLMSVGEKSLIEKELISELKKLMRIIGEQPELNNGREYDTIRFNLAKSEKKIFEQESDLNRLTDEYNNLISSFPIRFVAMLRRL